MKQLIEDLISAMEYHVEQTRPIHSTTVALQAAREALKAQPTPVQPVQEPVAWADALFDAIKHGDAEHQNWLQEKLKSWVIANPPTAQPTPVPASWLEMVTANLVREGVNKHKARELAEHFYAKLKEKNNG
jgi:hypothetical protein